MKTTLPFAAVLWCWATWTTAQPPATDEPLPDQTVLDRILLESPETPEWVEENGIGPIPGILRLNRAEASELTSTGLCDGLQALALVEYRRAYGPLRSVYELRLVPLWDSATIRKALPYVRLEESPSTRPLHQRLLFGRGELLARWSRRWGGVDPLPSPDRMLLRWRWRHRDDLSLGLVLDKDPGETWWNGPPHPGPDYVSAHVYVGHPASWCRALALGDYEIRWGQGLAIWQGGGFMLGAQADRRRWSEALRPHTGAVESGFFRGVAAQLGWGKQWEGLCFVSSQRRDATLGTNGNLTALRESGYHRTESERAGRKILGEKVAGAAVQWRGPRANVRAYTLWTRFDRPIEPDSTVPYRRFAFRGQSEGLIGGDAVLSLPGATLYGEAVGNVAGSWALLLGAHARLGDALRISAVARHFSKTFTALHAAPASQSGRSEGETGLELSVSLQLGRACRALLRTDMYRFPWLRYRIGAPSWGHDWSAELHWQATPKLLWVLQLRQNQRERDGIESGEPEAQTRSALSLRLEARMSEHWEWRTRAEVLRASSTAGHPMGCWLGQDLLWARNGWGVQARLAVFHVESHEARLYVYENQVRYAFSAPAVQGSGLRWYLNVRADWGGPVQLWARIAQTVQVGGEAPVDMSLQCQWSF